MKNTAIKKRENIALVFKEHFKNWDIELPIESIEAGSKDNIVKHGWSISFLFGKKNGKEYLDYYAMHRMTNDSHVRIWESGTVTNLPAVFDVYGFNPDIPGDEEKKQQRYYSHNKKVKQLLIEKGLLQVANINFVLRTDDRNK